jgi:hypothetical protein
MDVKDVECKGVELIYLVQNRVSLCAAVRKKTKLKVP